jgi:translation initiation factor IF-1
LAGVKEREPQLSRIDKRGADWYTTGPIDEGSSVARDDLIQIQGRVVEALAGGHFRVEGDQGHSFLARISGRLRRYHIKVVPGDRVTIAVSPYDLSHGFIVYRSS